MSADREAAVDAFLGSLRALLLAGLVEGSRAAPAPDRGGRTLRVKEVAERYNTTVKSVYRWVRSGMLPVLRLPGRDGAAGDYRFRESDLAEFDRRREGNWSSHEPVVLTVAGQAVPIATPRDAFGRGRHAGRARAS